MPFPFSNINKLSTPKQEKPTPTQEELRVKLEDRLNSLEPILDEGEQQYSKSLEDGTFDDQDGEELGSGERRKIEMQNKLTSILDRAEKMREKLDSGEILLDTQEEIQTIYIHTEIDPNTNQTVQKQELISLNLESKLSSFISFYSSHNIDLPPNFEDTIRDIWNNNLDDIEKEIQTHGFNEILIIPPTPDLKDLAEKMTMENGYYFYQTKDDFSEITSPHKNKPRIILVHNVQNLNDHPELKATKNIKGEDVNLDQTLSLEDYIIFQNKYFTENQKYLDDKTATWTSSKSGSRLVYSDWLPSYRRLYVVAIDLSLQVEDLGARSARCFT